MLRSCAGDPVKPPAQAWQVPATDGPARRVALFEAGYDEPALAVTAVDGDRIGMTGRSGGGAYTWITAAIDERVKVAVPVAGMTDDETERTP